MSEQISATVNGHPALELNIELRRGGKPSTFDATLPPETDVHGAVEIELHDTTTSRVLCQFTVIQVETLGDGRVVVHGVDRRHDWQRPVHADLNLPVGDGTAWHEDEPLAAQKCMEKLFVAAGLASEDAPTLPGGIAFPIDVRARGELGAEIESLLDGLGLTVSVSDDGDLLVQPIDAVPEVDRSKIIESTITRAELPATISVIGGPPIELIELTDWVSVLPDDDGVQRELSEVLSEWGVDERAARQACLSDGGFDELLPKTGTNSASRLAKLKRFAFRLFLAQGQVRPWLPVGGLHDDGSFRPPLLTARIVRARGVAPKHPADKQLEEIDSDPIDSFELDPERHTVYLPRPPFSLAEPAGGSDDPTLQDRRVSGPARLTLTVARASDQPPFTREVAIGGAGKTLRLAAWHLVAVYKNGVQLNRAALDAEALELAATNSRERLRRKLTLAGVDRAQACGSCERVVILAGPGGLTTTLLERPPIEHTSLDTTRREVARGRASGPIPSGLHQPINAFRAGPLIVRADGDTPESESVLAVEATHRRADTGALELRHPGTLAFAFHLPSVDASKFGRWFFVGGVEVTESGNLCVLGRDERHAEIPQSQLFEARHAAPQGMRGLIVSLGDEPVFVDGGPLVSDSRGREPGAASSLVYDLDRSSLSKRKRGGLQFLSVLALSPAHQQERARDGGWVPALNLREGETDNPEVTGRGLFVEGDGHALGRLTARLQGGPILGDAPTCRKHLYGVASDDDGLYRESAGHVSTDAFFKIPGDPVHDAPIKFYAQDFAGGIPPWTPYEAQLKYDSAEHHPWNHKQREGRWKIQYRVPFLPDIPPTWKPPVGPPRDPVTGPPTEPVIPSPLYLPHDIRPAVSEHELWAPSHDWVPAPSDRTQEREVAYPGPSIKSEGWAQETSGLPEPGLGGGVLFLPPGVAMPAAQIDGGTRQTFVALHPEVVLAFGHPGFSVGRVHSGWALQMAASGGHIELAPRDIDASIPEGLSRGFHVTGHMQVGPDGASFGASQALRLGEADSEGIAFGDDTELYRESEATLRTDGDLSVGGKLTVEGLIDPTGLELSPQSANPGGVAANTLWMNNSDSRLYHGAAKLALSSELPSSPIPVSAGGTGSTSANGAINELINNATLDSSLAPADELMLRTSLVGRKSSIANLLATVGGLAQLSAVTDGHKLLVIDDSGVAKYVRFEDLHPGGANLVCVALAYTGSGVSGKTVALNGINRAHWLMQTRYDAYGADQSFVFALGSTGAQRRVATNATTGTDVSLDAPGAGSSQTLTINSNGSWINGSGVAYRLLVFGTPT